MRFLPQLAHQQEQMTLLRFRLHHGNVQRFSQMSGHAQFEELTAVIPSDVHGIVVGTLSLAIPRAPLRRDLTQFQASAHGREFGLKVFCIHTF